MKSINPSTDYLNLHRYDATILDASNDFKNDLGQRITFYEDPILGEDGCVWVAFPDASVAFRSAFYDLDDMTAKTGSMFSPSECIKNGWSTDEDMDYVPRLVGVIAYYERNGYSEIAGVYDSEEQYIDALPSLEKYAKDHGFERITESVGASMVLKFETE